MITWLDGGFLFELNKEYGDLGQEAVLNAPEKFSNYTKLYRLRMQLYYY